MILYFADRTYNVIGLASTNLPQSLEIISDSMTEEVGTGFATFSYTIQYESSQRKKAEELLACGNYIFRNDGESNEFQAAVIVESTVNGRENTIELYAEDAGFDLINGLAPAYISTTEENIAFYVNLFIEDTGYEININEESDDIVQLLYWDSESTITERLLNIAESFEVEIYFTYLIDNFFIRKRYVNIQKKRGKDIEAELRVGRDLSNVVVKRSMADVATALNPVGAKPEGSAGIFHRNDPVSGKPKYTWIKFADTVKGINMNDSGSSSRFMGLKLNQDNIIESSNPLSYSWRRLNFDSTLITLKTCTTGYLEPKDDPSDADRYTWIRFAKDENGKDISNTATGMSYIGIATGKDSSTPTNTVDDYNWEDMRYESADRHVILLDSLANATAISMGSDGYLWLKFGTSASGANMADAASGKTYAGISLCRPGSTKSSSAGDYSWVKIDYMAGSGGYIECPTVNAGVKVGNSYVWYMFSNLEDQFDWNPSAGNYIALLYDQAVASPMSTNKNDYADWHQVDGDEVNGITLQGYSYDDGDFYVEGKLLKSRSALKEWARDVSTADTTFGHIIRSFSSEATRQKDLFDDALKELKKRKELSITYEAEVFDFPPNISIGDYVRITDRDGELYLRARLMKMDTSIIGGSKSVTFGDYSVVGSGLYERPVYGGTVVGPSVSLTGARIFYLAADPGVVPSVLDPGWSTEVVTPTKDQRVWQMTETTTNGVAVYSDPIDITGVPTISGSYTLYKFVAANANGDILVPSAPDTIDPIPPEGWSLNEPAENLQNGGVFSVNLITYMDGSFTYGEVVQSTSYSMAAQALVAANQATTAAAAAEENAKTYTDEQIFGVSEEIAAIRNETTDISAKLTSVGFTVNDENAPTLTILTSRGLEVAEKLAGDQYRVIAQFDNDNSYVDYLKVNQYLTFGNHRAQAMTMLEHDGTTSAAGTAFIWTGGE